MERPAGKPFPAIPCRGGAYPAAHSPPGLDTATTQDDAAGGSTGSYAANGLLPWGKSVEPALPPFFISPSIMRSKAVGAVLAPFPVRFLQPPAGFVGMA